MILLALDTSTLTASVGVVRADGAVPTVIATADRRTGTHSDVLVPLIDDVLGEAGVDVAALDAVAVGAGPGSFTGLRIGMSTGKGLAFSAGIPLWAVSSLAALAQDAVASVPDGAVIAAALDARRDEVYAGFYKVGAGGVVAPMGDEWVIAPGDLVERARALTGEQIFLCGDGAVAYAEQLAEIGTIAPDARTSPSAHSIARIALAGPRTDVLTAGAPAYLRKSEAEIKFPHGNPGGAFKKA